MNARERRQVYRRAVPLLCGLVAAVSITRLHGTVQEERSLGLPPLLSPADNPMTPEKVALGRRLFFDKRLSVDNSISCATCHVPDVGFADPHPVSIGTRGRTGKRNSPSVLNTAYLEPLMWDGKARTLEEQALLPFFAADEMDLPPDEAATKLRRQGYSAEFNQVFGEDVSSRTLAMALAAYQRSLGAGDSPFDRYLFRDEQDAISVEARRGFDVFLSAKCDGCHLVMTRGLHPFALSHVMFTDGKFHNLGVGTDKEPQDAGRYDVTADEADWGRFRTPTLRNVALTAPYFHDGSAPTLEEVVKFYDEGGKPNRNLDPAMKPLRLTDQQKADLVAFLHTLTTSASGSLAQEAGRVRQP
ncbi:MAG TPA: cytochrome c peroxidase [Longimicrobium sp.]|nr:cytochrome c peroxidase [Longimicrobium sp.]